MSFTIYADIRNGYGCAEKSPLLRAFYLFCVVSPVIFKCIERMYSQ